MAASNPAEDIRDRLALLRERIGRAAARAQRDPSEITLVAVSKTHPAPVVQAAIGAGLRVFGENRIEEAGPKMRELASVPGLEWHMIGHIQHRKAREVASAEFALVHSVDTLRLAERLAQAAAEAGRRQAVLLEVNVSGEASKAGFAAAQPGEWRALLPEVRRVLALPSLEVRGLMTMAPIVNAAEQARPYFDRLRALRDYLEQELAQPLPALSMGMTDDFEAAIPAGATIVRIGRAIFGERG